MRHKARTTACALVVALSLFLTAHADAGCGDYNLDGHVSSTDALGVLATAVHTMECTNARCDVDDDGGVDVTDVLLVLKSVVGDPVTLHCDGVPISEVGDMPSATGPVGDGVSLDSIVAGIGGQTPSGIDLGSLGPQTFGSESSRAACETTNMIAAAMRAAVQSDTLLCYADKVFAANANLGVDFYDGQTHVFALDFGPPNENGGASGGPISVRITRTASTITDLQIITCGNTPNGVAESEYLHATIDGPDFQMVNKSVMPGDSGARGYRVETTGQLDDLGHVMGTKTVDVTQLFQDSYASGFGEMSFGQTADEFTVDGYDVTSFSHPTYGDGESHREISAGGQLFDFNDVGQPHQVGLEAVGHGAARAHLSGSDTNGPWDDTIVEGWNGDTTLPDATAAAAFIPGATAAALVTPAESVTIDFGEGETFDCASPTEATLFIDLAMLGSSCTNLALNYEWMSCEAIIPPTQS